MSALTQPAPMAVGHNLNFDRNLRLLHIRSKGQLVETAVRSFLGVAGARRWLPSEAHLRDFIREVGHHYHNNPYHNFHHAVDTTNSMGWLLTRSTVAHKLPDFYAFALLVAALVHDIDHPGTDNQWEIKTHSDWARQFENQAVLEHHSRDVASWILRERRPEFLAALSPAKQELFWQLLDLNLIATDFSRHGAFLQEMEYRLENGGIDFRDPEGLSLVSRALIKAADIANTAKDFPLARLWGRRVMREYWAQGRREKSRDLPVGPLNDERKVDFYTAQAWFIENQVLKLFELLARVVGEVQESVDALRRNLICYREGAEPKARER